MAGDLITNKVVSPPDRIAANLDSTPSSGSLRGKSSPTIRVQIGTGGTLARTTRLNLIADANPRGQTGNVIARFDPDPLAA